MKQLLPVFAFLISFSPIFGQVSSNDCLSPTGPRQFGNLEYEQKIEEILLSQFSEYQILRFQQSETFWAIELDTTDIENTIYFITHVSPTKSIWNSLPETDGIEAKKFTKNIQQEDFKLISSLFSAALGSVCAKCGNIGMDGTTYYFSNIQIMGKLWLGGLPNAESKKERLVLICQEINKLIIDEKHSKFNLSEDLKTPIVELTRDFEKQNANHN